MIEATTGALSFVTAPDFELPTDSGANNVYDVIVGAARNVVGIRGAISSNVKLPDHAARSIG
jgi:hypothetical protein